MGISNGIMKVSNEIPGVPNEIPGVANEITEVSNKIIGILNEIMEEGGRKNVGKSYKKGFLQDIKSRWSKIPFGKQRYGAKEAEKDEDQEYLEETVWEIFDEGNSFGNGFSGAGAGAEGGETAREGTALEHRLREKLVEELQENGQMSDEEVWRYVDRMIMTENRGAGLSLAKMEDLRRDLFFSVRRLDILQELIDDPEITEIMVNGYRDIFIEKGGRLIRWHKRFITEARLEDVIQQIAGRCNRVVNEQHPIVDARLENGARVNIVLPPVSLEGPILTIRRFPDEPITMKKLVRSGSLTKEAADFLEALVRAGYSVVVGGGTSTGKTTFLNALTEFIPSDERIITIEDNAELQIREIPNLVRLEVKNANLEENTEITIRDLIRTALRMRPDRIIIGEVRGAEAGDFLTALNTGHDGSLGSAHANNVRDMISRLEMMVLMGMDLPVGVIRRQIASGVDILIHLTRDKNGRRCVDEIAEITGISNDEVQIRTLYKRNEEGIFVREAELCGQEKLNRRSS